MKTIKLPENRPKDKEKLESEIMNYLTLNYFHILKFYRYFKDEKEIHIITEHTNNGSLEDFIKL